MLPFTNDVITLSFGSFGYQVLVILDNFIIKSHENIYRYENSHQNLIGFTKLIANVREKLRVDKKILVSEKILVYMRKILSRM